MTQQKQLTLLLSTQRSGSTWLADMLSKAAGDRLAVYGELLLPEQKIWDVGESDYCRFIESPQYHDRRPWALFRYLDTLYEQSNSSVAFKLMYSHVRLYPEIIPYVIRRHGHIKIVHLIRENYLNTLISLERLRTSMVAHVHDGRVPKTVQVELDPATLMRSINYLRLRITTFHRIFQMLPNQYTVVHYEALAAGDQQEMTALLGFLGLDTNSYALESDLARISRGQSRSLRNYAEVKNVLVGTHYENLLEQN